MWFGDLEKKFMEKIEDDVQLKRSDIIFAPHHGRESGKIPSSWLEQIEPKIIVIGEAPSKHLNYYSDYNTIKQNSAGHILFECLEQEVRMYVQKNSYQENFLINDYLTGKNGLYYLGTLKLNQEYDKKKFSRISYKESQLYH